MKKVKRDPVELSKSLTEDETTVILNKVILIPKDCSRKQKNLVDKLCNLKILDAKLTGSMNYNLVYRLTELGKKVRSVLLKNSNPEQFQKEKTEKKEASRQPIEEVILEKIKTKKAKFEFAQAPKLHCYTAVAYKKKYKAFYDLREKKVIKIQEIEETVSIPVEAVKESE
jgi:hypothetical protein